MEENTIRLEEHYYIENYNLLDAEMPVLVYAPRLSKALSYSDEELLNFTKEQLDTYEEDFSYTEPHGLGAGSYALENLNQCALFDLDENGEFVGTLRIIENFNPLQETQLIIENGKVVEERTVNLANGNFIMRIIFEEEKTVVLYFDEERGVIYNLIEKWKNHPEGKNEVSVQFDPHGVKTTVFNQIKNTETHYYQNGQVKFWLNFETNEGAQYEENGTLIYEDVLENNELVRRMG